MPETTRNLDEVEQKVKPILAKEKVWVVVFEMMEQVKVEKLYVESYKNFTQWVKHLSKTYSLPESELWRWLEAGHVYQEVEKYCTEHQKPLTPLEKLKVSPENLCLAKTIAGTDKEKLTELVARMEFQTLSREDWRNMARIKHQVLGDVNGNSSISYIQARREREISDHPNGVAALAEKADLAKTQLIFAIQKNKDWIPYEEVPYIDQFIPEYNVKDLCQTFRNFSIHDLKGNFSGHYDFLIVENLSCEHRNELALRGIKIVISGNDLKNFQVKRIAYMDNCDYLYVAVLPEMVEQAKSESRKSIKCLGVLSLNDQGNIKVELEPKKVKPPHPRLRENVLTSLILRLSNAM